MRTLILMRHAKSSWADPGLADHDRPLNNRGRRRAAAMGDWLRAKGYLPGEVITSSARRTLETLEGLRIEAPVHVTKALYHAGPEAMLSVLRGAGAPCVLMLGHNPGIAGFAEMLVSAPPDHPRFEDYPTCATLVAEFPHHNWAKAQWRQASAKDFVIPRDLHP